MDHSAHIALMSDEMTEENLIDAKVYGANDAIIGKVSHVHGSGIGMKVIVDAGGFLGIGAKPVAMTTSELSYMRDDQGTVHATTSWTKDQVMDLPEHVD